MGKPKALKRGGGDVRRGYGKNRSPLRHAEKKRRKKWTIWNEDDKKNSDLTHDRVGSKAHGSKHFYWDLCAARGGRVLDIVGYEKYGVYKKQLIMSIKNPATSAYPRRPDPPSQEAKKPLSLKLSSCSVNTLTGEEKNAAEGD